MRTSATTRPSTTSRTDAPPAGSQSVRIFHNRQGPGCITFCTKQPPDAPVTISADCVKRLGVSLKVLFYGPDIYLWYVEDAVLYDTFGICR